MLFAALAYLRNRAEILSKVRARYHESEELQRKHKISARKHQVARYGLTPESYTAMVEVQQSRCAICSELVNGVLHVDHDHFTGKVRGLLCGPCNRLLGLAKDDVKILQTAVDYLGKVAPQ